MSIRHALSVFFLLLGLSMPLVGQTVAFVDEKGAVAATYLEGTHAYVRLTASSGGDGVETRNVTLSSEIAGDSETLVLRETSGRSGVFAGQIRLAPLSYPATAGVLETLAAGNLNRRDTIHVEHASATATATLVGARIELLDESGNPVPAFTAGDSIRVRVTSHLGNDPSNFDNTWLHVTVPGSGDSEDVPLTETWYRSGIYEGSLPLQFASAVTDNHVLEAQPGQQIVTLETERDDFAASTQHAVAASRVQILDTQGRPVELIPESSRIRVRVVNDVANSSPVVQDTVNVALSSQIAGDDETLTLTETSYNSRTFEGEIDLRLGAGINGNGFLETNEVLGPPHQFDTVEASFGGVADTATTYGSQVWFLDNAGSDAESYHAGGTAYLRVEDHNAGQPTQIDFVQATVRSLATNDTENVSLRETGKATHVFEGSVPMQNAYATSADGVLQATAGDPIEAQHGDALGYTASGDQAMIQMVTLQFVDFEGRPIQEILQGSSPYLRVLAPQANQSSWANDTVTVTLQSRYCEDVETFLLRETGTDTGIFFDPVRTISGWAPPGNHYGGSLETCHSGEPSFFPETVTASFEQGVVSAPVVSSRVAFLDAAGAPTSSYLVGDTVRVQVIEFPRDFNIFTVETFQLTVQASGGETETILMTETGPAAGIFEGTIATTSGYGYQGDGVLRVSGGMTLSARHRAVDNNPAEIVATAQVASGAVELIDGQGNPAEAYLEGGRVWVRVRDSFANVQGWAPDSARVELSTALSADAETLWLTETGPSTGVFEGSIDMIKAPAQPQDGTLQTGAAAGELDTVQVSYMTVTETATDSAGLLGSRVAFVNAAGQVAQTFAIGTRAYVRVEDQNANAQANVFDTTPVTLRSLSGGDTEYLTLVETARDSGVFQGSIELSAQAGAYPGDGSLQVQTSEEIEAEHLSPNAFGAVTARAQIASLSLEFVDEQGNPVGVVLENGRARIRAYSLLRNQSPYSADSFPVTLRSLYGADQEIVTLTETGQDTAVFEGSIRVIPNVYTYPGNGALDVARSTTENDTVTVEAPDATASARVVGSLVFFIDDLGRDTETYAFNTRVYVRVIEPSSNDPGIRDTVQATVQGTQAGAGGGPDVETITLTETGFDTGVFEGSIQSQTNSPAPGNGELSTSAKIEVVHTHANGGGQSRDEAGFVSLTIAFIDAEGRPAAEYLEGSWAYLRVTDYFFDDRYSQQTLAVPVTSDLAGDSEQVTLTETSSTSGVFEGRIRLRLGYGLPGNGTLEVQESAGPPHEFDTLRATHANYSDSATATARLAGSRTWFVNAAGQPAEFFAVGGKAYIRVEDHNANQNDLGFDTTQVTVTSLWQGDQELVTLLEVGKNTGVFQGSIQLRDIYGGGGITNPGNGELAVTTGETIRASHNNSSAFTVSIGEAGIQYSAVEFIDREGRPTSELPEGGEVRVRVYYYRPGGSPYQADTTQVEILSGYGGDREIVTLTETGDETHVFEGSILSAFAPAGSGYDGNNRLETSHSGPPSYLGDEVTVISYDAEATARTVGSAVRFLDAYGRETAVYAVRDRVFVRVEDHNLNDAYTRDTAQVSLAVESMDSETLTLTETGFNTGIFEGSILSLYGSGGPQDGVLQVGPGSEIVASHANAFTPNPTEARASVVGASVQFLDAAGQPAESYLESSRAYIRVADAFASSYPQGRDTIWVTVSTGLEGDSEAVALTETGLETRIFEGSVPLRLAHAMHGNGVVDTYQSNGPPHEFDTLTVQYESFTDTAATTGSRTWFVNAAGQPVESFATGGKAYIRVEDHNANQNDLGFDTTQVTVNSLWQGDQELVTLLEVGKNTGVFQGSIQLRDIYSGYMSPGDGELKVTTGEVIRATHHDSFNFTVSTGEAEIQYTAVEFIDREGRPTSELPEGGLVRIRVFQYNQGSPYQPDTTDVEVLSRYGGDREVVRLTETGEATNVFEGSVASAFAPSGSGSQGNNRLETSNSGQPAYLGDEVRVVSYDAEARATTVGSSVRFLDGYGRETSVYAVGDRVFVRLEDHHLNNPQTRDTTQADLAVSAGDLEAVTVTETGFDTGVFEGSIASAYGPVAMQDGLLQVGLGNEITATHNNAFSPTASVARASVAGGSVLFVDAAGQPAASYLESSRAYIRVADVFANGNPGSADSLSVTVTTELENDNETVTLTETGASTGIFEGSIRLRLAHAMSGNGTVETYQSNGPPHEFDTLTVRHGSLSDTVGTTGSRTWFVNAAGQPVEYFAISGKAYIRVEDHNANENDLGFDTTQVTVNSLWQSDQELVTLLEVGKNTGVFQGSIQLGSAWSSPSQGDGVLAVVTGEPIRATHDDSFNFTVSTDEAEIQYSAVEFIDREGRPTAELPEGGAVRIRVYQYNQGGQYQLDTTDVEVFSRYGADREVVRLTETGETTNVYEGSVASAFAPAGSGSQGNSRLETSNSGSPAYLGDEIRVVSYDAEARARTVGSSVRFLDGYGRETSVYAVGDRVFVRVEDHHLNNPQTRDTAQADLAVNAGDLEAVTVTETGFDTGVFEGSIASAPGSGSAQDGLLQVGVGSEITASHHNAFAPNASVARASVAGGSVLFVDAAGQPAASYLESSRAYIRVVDTFANGNPGSTDTLSVTVTTELENDNETVTLTETGPSTGIFEGSIRLRLAHALYGNGTVETYQASGPPHEFDTLTARYGPLSDTVGTTGSRTWFVNAAGQPVESFAIGGKAYIRVEDHNANQNDLGFDTTQVTVTSLWQGDQELVTLLEVGKNTGVFQGSIQLLQASIPPSQGDGELTVTTGEAIRATHHDSFNFTVSSGEAEIQYTAVEFIDREGRPTSELPEGGAVRIRVFQYNQWSNPYQPDTTDVEVFSRYGADREIVRLTETGEETNVFEGSVASAFAPAGSGSQGNSRLEVSHSGPPAYLGDEVRVVSYDAEAHATTVGSSVRFLDGYGRETSVYAVGDRVLVRVEDHNLNSPQTRDTTQADLAVNSGDLEAVTLTETGFDTGVFEGSIASAASSISMHDGLLQVGAGSEIAASHNNAFLPTASVARASVAGGSVLFIDAAGQPAASYLESSRAYLRVVDTFANGSPVVTDTLSVTVTTELEGDNETVTLTETGPSTGIFEGSIGLRLAHAVYSNGTVETYQASGPPHEFDTLTARYGSLSDTVVTTGSRTWFVNAAGQPAEFFAVGGRAYIRVEDHTANQNEIGADITQVTVNSLWQGDQELVTLVEVGQNSGVFQGSIQLRNATSAPSQGDGELAVTTGEAIRATHGDSFNFTVSTDEAEIQYAAVEFLNRDGQPTTELLEGGEVRIRVFLYYGSPYDVDTTDVEVLSRYGADREIVQLTETGPATSVFEGTVPSAFAPPGSGTQGNNRLEIASSGPPAYLGEEVTAISFDAQARAVMVGSRVTFLGLRGQVVETYARRSLVRVRVEDYNRVGAGTLTVPVSSPSDADTVQLTEVAPGLFEGSIPSQAQASAAGDGVLTAEAGQVVQVDVPGAFSPSLTIGRVTFIDNWAPQTQPDAAETVEPQPVSIPVLANDLDDDLETMTVVAVTQGANGSVAINPDNTVTYTPVAGFAGTDTFTYIVADPRGGENSAQVTVIVTLANQPPVANPDTATTLENQAVTVNVLANDTDPNNDALQVTGVTGVTNGAAVVNPDNTVTFTPAAGWSGDTTFSYIIRDARDAQAASMVTVTVTPVDDLPVAVADVATVTEDSVNNAIDVLANDTDPDGGVKIVTSVASPTVNGGTVSVTGGGTGVAYTPAANFCGTDTFTYTLNGGSSSAVTVTVTCVDDSAVAVADAATVAEDSTNNAIDVLANDSDLEGDATSVTAVTSPTANGGTVAVMGGGTGVSYTPAADFCGTDTFAYTLNGGSSATVTVTVTCEDDNAVAVADAATVNEDSSNNAIDVLANDTDADGGTTTVASVTQPTNGTVTIAGGGTGVSYTPAANFCGTDSFTYTLNGGSSATVTVTVTCVNDAPVAGDDAASVSEDGSVTIPVRDNDTDPESDALDVVSVTQGANGAVVLNANDTVTYTPQANFSGTDTFTYTVSDGNGTDTATVTVTVGGVNDQPTANDDAATVEEDGSVSISVKGNDSDQEGDALDVTAVTQGTSGSVTLNADDTITYIPNANFSGTDAFTYTVSDGNGGADTATVTVTVTPVNDAPVAADDAALAAEDTPTAIEVKANDSDVDGDALDVTAVTQGTSGTVTLNADDTITYTPGANFNGTDTFTYTLSDGNGGADTATVVVTVGGANDAPVANADAAAATEDNPVTVAVLANDTDLDNDTLDVVSVTQGANGSVAINADETVTYTPNANFNGTDTFTYTVADGNGGADTATVTVTVAAVNDEPAAAPDAASTGEDTPVAIEVKANDTDLDGDTLDVVSITQGASGTVTLNGNDTITYAPAVNFHGVDTFTYTISDGNGGTGTTTVTVTVGSLNDAPVANPDAASVAEDGAVSVTVLGNDTDLDLDTLDVTSVSQGANGSVTVNANDTVTYTPAADFHGTDTFTYTVSDGNGGSDTGTVTVTVTPVNDAPAASNDLAATAEDTPVVVAVRSNDSDVDGDAVDVVSVTQGAKGAVVLNGDDTVTYTPQANFHGVDTFTYTVSDGNGGGDTATVTVTVGSANDAPDAINDSATTAEDNPVSIAVLGNDTDLDLDTLAIAGVTQGTRGAVTVNGNTVTYTPNPNTNGVDTFTYTATDGNGGSDTATVTVTVTPVNDPPAAVNDAATTLAETAVTINVLANDADVDSAALTVPSVTQGAHGTVVRNANQTVTYTPAAGWVGPDSFTYTVADGAGGTATATVNVTVQAPPRVNSNLQVLYTFNEGSGTTVQDVSGVGTPIHLTIGSAAAVTWLPGALSIDSATFLQSAGAATKVITASQASNEITMEAWVAAGNLTQSGPATLLSVAQASNKRNFTMGQITSTWEGRLRTSTTSQTGTGLTTPAGSATLNLAHVVYTRTSAGAVRMYINGTQVSTATLTGNFSAWVNTYKLGIGNEFGGGRPWIGDLHLMAVYSRALTGTEVRQNFLAGAN